MQSGSMEKSQSIEHHSADSRMDHKEHLDQPQHQLSRSESIQDAEVQPVSVPSKSNKYTFL